MGIAGALIGGHLARPWNSSPLRNNVLVNIVLVILVILGTTYLSYFSFYLVALIDPMALPIPIIAAFIVCPILTGYVVKRTTKNNDVERYLFFALFVLTTITCLLVASVPGSNSTAITISFFVCVLASSLYFLLAKVGIRKAEQRNAAVNLPAIPTAKVVL